VEPRVALITAGAQGLGGAISRHLVEQGHRVLIHFNQSRGGADQVLELARARGVEAEAISADLSSAAGRIALVEHVDAVLGDRGLDILINNLGVYPEGRLLELTNETFERTFNLTCTTVFHLTQLLLPRLRRACPGARVINLGDANCDRIVARPEATPYHIAKLGVHLLTRTFAAELGADGITVNMLSPGFLENSVGEPGTPIPLGRKGRFEDILGGLDYLLSDAAAYVSGTNLRVSGAWNL
jgi:NAD(P)-dependent dehydrogenase (short-subunit alcohol dehydrogenase family)